MYKSLLIEEITQDPIEKTKLLDLAKDCKSFNGIDLIVAHVTNFKPGYFVEFGAADGVRASNTYLLEKRLGWNGILAEPGKCFHTDLPKFRSCHIDHGCVAKTSNEKVFFLEEKEPKQLYSHVHGYVGSKSFEYEDRYILETISLNDLLDKYDAPSIIDYISVDTKGGELDILTGFDFQKRRVKVWSIDWYNRFLTMDTKKEMIFINQLMVNNGYKRVQYNTSHEGWYHTSHEGCFVLTED